MKQNGIEEELWLPIRSVPFDTTARLIEEAYVEPPRSKKMNVETMEFDMVKDEFDPGYQRNSNRPICSFSSATRCTP